MVNIGSEVRVIGEVFPNIRGLVTAIEDNKASIVFKAYYTTAGVTREQWEMVSLPVENLVPIQLTEKDERKEIPEQFKEVR